MHYLTSNFNLMESNSHWDKLKKNYTFIDKNYNGLTISLNEKNLNNYNFFHSIFYVDISNFNQTISPYFIALLLWYPAYENLFSIIRKKLSNSSVINADNKHLHQLIFLFLKKKRIPQFFSNFFAALIINMFNLIVFYLATENMYQTKNLIIIIICNLMIYNLVYLHLKKSIR